MTANGAFRGGRCGLRCRKSIFVFLPCLLLILAGCGEPEEVSIFVSKAKALLPAFEGLYLTVGERSTKCIVWDLDRNALHQAHSWIDKPLRFRGGDGPVTVFLVEATLSEYVGTYSISHQPALKQWYRVYAVNFATIDDRGTPLGSRSFSGDPPEKRQVADRPERGSAWLFISLWIESLPSG